MKVLDAAQLVAEPRRSDLADERRRVGRLVAVHLEGRLPRRGRQGPGILGVPEPLWVGVIVLHLLGLMRSFDHDAGGPSPAGWRAASRPLAFGPQALAAVLCSRPAGRSVSVASRRRTSADQVPATRPSTRNDGRIWRLRLLVDDVLERVGHDPPAPLATRRPAGCCRRPRAGAAATGVSRVRAGRVGQVVERPAVLVLEASRARRRAARPARAPAAPTFRSSSRCPRPRPGRRRAGGGGRRRRAPSAALGARLLVGGIGTARWSGGAFAPPDAAVRDAGQRAPAVDRPPADRPLGVDLGRDRSPRDGSLTHRSANSRISSFVRGCDSGEREQPGPQVDPSRPTSRRSPDASSPSRRPRRRRTRGARERSSDAASRAGRSPRAGSRPRARA